MSNLSAENSKAWALCCLNVQILHIVPAFLQERYKEVDTEIKVLANVLFAKVDCADRSTHAQNLLELELNSGLNFFHLILNAFRLTDHDRELVDFVEHVTEQSRDLSHERLASDQLVEGGSPFLDRFTLLVKFLETFNIDESDTGCLCLLAVECSADDSTSFAWVGLVRKAD